MVATDSSLLWPLGSSGSPRVGVTANWGCYADVSDVHTLIQVERITS